MAMSDEARDALRAVAHYARLLAGEAQRALAIIGEPSPGERGGIAFYVSMVGQWASKDMAYLDAAADEDLTRGSQGGEG